MTTIAAKSPSFATTVSKTAPPHVGAWTAGSPTNAAGTDGHFIYHGTLLGTETGTDIHTTVVLTGTLHRIHPCHRIPRVGRATAIQIEILTETSRVMSHAHPRSPNHVPALPPRRTNPSHVPHPHPPPLQITIANTDFPPVDHLPPRSPPCPGTFVQTGCALNPVIVTNGRGTTMPIGARVLRLQVQAEQVAEVARATTSHTRVSWRLAPYILLCDYHIYRS